MNPLLELRAVSAGYGDLTVVREVSFEVPRSSVTALLGRNGAGKTTLLKAVSGLIPPASGAVLLDGEDITRTPPYQRQAQGVGFAQENKRIFKKLTVEQNLLYGTYGLRLRPAAAKKRVHDAFDRFPVLADKRHDMAGYLSGGQQQMLAISMALIGDPQLVMLDEPFAGLAPSIVQDVMETVMRLRDDEGRTLLIVEQAVDLALHMADHVQVIDVGSLVLHGRADEPGMRSKVQNVYFAASHAL